MKPTKVFIYSNDTGLSKATANELVNVLSTREFEIGLLASVVMEPF